jgi:hypothetical protein
MEGGSVGHNFERDLPRSSPLKPLNQIKANLAGMVVGWSLFNNVSNSVALYSKWLLLPKIDYKLEAPSSL